VDIQNVINMNDNVIIQIVNKSNNPLPEYSTELSSGMDIRANLEREITIAPNERVLIPTGLHVAIPKGYEIQIRPRSGLALKKGLTVLNTPGTIDGDYRGDIGVILFNTSDQLTTIHNGDRIAQMVITKVEYATLQEVDELDQTERGEGGFGHTGIS